MEKPNLTDWCFVRATDGALYTKPKIVAAILRQVSISGTFDVSRLIGGLGVVGKSEISEYDPSKVGFKILAIKLNHDGDIEIMTDLLQEYILHPETMKSWFEIFQLSRRRYERSVKEAEKAAREAKIAEERRETAAKKVPETTEDQKITPEKVRANLSDLRRAVNA